MGLKEKQSTDFNCILWFQTFYYMNNSHFLCVRYLCLLSTQVSHEYECGN
jgi:hypothetical protein